MAFWWQRYPTLKAALRAEAVRGLGRLLVYSRRALITMAPAAATTREAVAADLFHAVGRMIRDHLTHQTPLHDPGLQRLLARLRERIEAVTAALTGISDSRFEASLLLAAIAQVENDVATARLHLDWATDRVSLIRSMELRERILTTALGLALAIGSTRSSATGLLRHLVARRQPGLIHPDTLNLLMLIAPRRSLLAAAGLPHSAHVLRHWSIMVHRRPRIIMARLASVMLLRRGPVALRKDLSVPPEPPRPPRVVRAMGGVGDLLMMTPGLRALARRIGQPVEFVAPARFRPLLAGNPSITFRAAEDLDHAWWQAGPIIDLTDCPASAVESQTAPHIRRDRIEIFAAAMGVAEHELVAAGDRPVFEPLPEDRQTAETWLQARDLSPRGFIAVQVSSAESYRDYPDMADLAVQLARIAPVVVVHDRFAPGYTAPGVHTAFNLPAGVAFALGSQARLIVAPDSSFVHLAAARDIPVVAIFGPIDAEVRTRRYPLVRIVSQADRMGCIPCWRNQNMICKASGTLRSICLHTLPAEMIVAAVHEQLARTA